MHDQGILKKTITLSNGIQVDFQLLILKNEKYLWI